MTTMGVSTVGNFDDRKTMESFRFTTEELQNKNLRRRTESRLGLQTIHES